MHADATFRLGQSPQGQRVRGAVELEGGTWRAVDRHETRRDDSSLTSKGGIVVTNPPPGFPAAPQPDEPPSPYAYPPWQYQPPYPPGPNRHEGLAVAGLVLGIVAVVSLG